RRSRPSSRAARPRRSSSASTASSTASWASSTSSSSRSPPTGTRQSSASRRPLQEQVDALVLGDGEAEPVVEPKRRIHPLDVDRDALASLVGLGEEILEELRPDPAAAVLGQERDVDDADLGLAAVNVEAAGRLPVDDDDVEA